MKNGPYSSNKNRARIIASGEPVRAFSRSIDKFMQLEGKDYEGQRHEVLPKSNFRLVFTINNTSGGVSFLGPNTKMRTYPLQDYFVVHFLPGMMPRFADVKPSEMTENFLPLRRLLGTDTATLVDAIQSAKSFETRQRFMEEFFRRSGLETAFAGGPHTKAVQLVRSCKGRITVGDLARRVGTTTRTIERMFLTHAGLTPKQFIRLIRFQHALQQMNARDFTNFADLAFSCGYTDQSHLIKEFKSFSLRSPGRI